MNATSASATAHRHRTNARHTAPTPDRTNGEANNLGPRPAAWLDDPDEAALSDDNGHEQPFAYDSGPENELRDATTTSPHAPFAADIAMKPTWMGDTGLQDDHLATWRLAEQQFDLKNTPPKAPKAHQGGDAPLDFDKKFLAEKNFKGKYIGRKKGFVYKRADDNVGDFPDAPPTLAPITIKISLDDLFHAISSLPLRCPIDAFHLQPLEGPTIQRASRIRNPDGSRHKHPSRRQLAIVNLPVQIHTLISKTAP